MTTKNAILHHLENDFHFTYSAQQPPEIGKRVELVIDGKPMAFVVSRIDQHREAVMSRAGHMESVTTYTVTVRAGRAL